MGKTLRSGLLLGAMLVFLTGCGLTQSSESPTRSSGVPGDTGRTKVIGSNSTVAGDAQATDQQRKWPLGPNR